MKYKIRRSFMDKFTKVKYLKGSVYETDNDDRGKLLIKKGFLKTPKVEKAVIKPKKAVIKPKKAVIEPSIVLFKPKKVVNKPEVVIEQEEIIKPEAVIEPEAVIKPEAVIEPEAAVAVDVFEGAIERGGGWWLLVDGRKMRKPKSGG